MLQRLKNSSAVILLIDSRNHYYTITMKNVLHSTRVKAASLTAVTVAIVSTPFIALAAYTPQQVSFDPNYNAQRNTGLGNALPQDVAAGIIAWVLGLLAIIALVLIIYGGFVWMFSRGNEEEVKKAKDILQGALFGLVIILASYGLTAYVFENLVDITNA